jgi:hypothetical protein
VRYFIRNKEGRELACPTLADLHALYAQGFLTDDDLVRPESSQRWTPVGSLPALRGVRERRAEPRRVVLVLVAALALALAVGILVRGGFR